jgi:DNA polymerase-3 subunit delta'
MALSDIKGQQRALNILRGAARRGRLASSYLFAGEDGIGKKTAAVNFAMALNCLDQQYPPQSDETDFGDACGVCSSCKRIAGGTHPDFLMVAPEDRIIKVEEIRAIEEALSFRAHEARVKTVIVDNAETMNAAAANAFLKTLEEPAPGTMIILVSSMPDRLPITIRSRCSRVNFRPLSASEVAEIIGEDEDTPSVTLSMGRPGEAALGELEARRERFMELLTHILTPGSKADWKDRQDIEGWLDMALLWLRDMAAVRTGGIPINSDMADELSTMSGEMPVEEILAAYAKLRQLRARQLFNLNKGITWNYAGCVLGNVING